jgi:hypothetical protein
LALLLKGEMMEKFGIEILDFNDNKRTKRFLGQDLDLWRWMFAKQTADSDGNTVIEAPEGYRIAGNALIPSVEKGKPLTFNAESAKAKKVNLVANGLPEVTRADFERAVDKRVIATSPVY